MLTTIQEVYFDLTDLIESGQIDDIKIEGFTEFETLREFLEEQRAKMSWLEDELTGGEGEESA